MVSTGPIFQLVYRDSCRESIGSIASRIRGLFYVSLTNFVIPGMQAGIDVGSDGTLTHVLLQFR
jgi:hypothetical protein